jgi:hypothetical protein
MPARSAAPPLPSPRSRADERRMSDAVRRRSAAWPPHERRSSPHRPVDPHCSRPARQKVGAPREGVGALPVPAPILPQPRRSCRRLRQGCGSACVREPAPYRTSSQHLDPAPRPSPLSVRNRARLSRPVLPRSQASTLVDPSDGDVCPGEHSGVNEPARCNLIVHRRRRSNIHVHHDH